MTLNIQSKEVLARLLATENITVEHQNVSTASFNVKDRVLTLPMWDDMQNFTYDHLVGHEVGHALYTDADGWASAIEKHGKNFKGFLNIVEDARIEKKIQRTYPGLKRSFIQSYKKMLSEGFFGRDETEINTFELIDRINVYFKCGMSTGTKFADDEKKWLDIIAKIETQDEAYKVALELFELAKEKKEKEQQAQKESEEEMQEDGEDDDNFSFDDSDMDYDDYDIDEDGDDSSEDGSGEGESEDSDLEETEEELKGSGDKSDSEDKGEEVETPVQQVSHSRIGGESPEPLNPNLPIAETDAMLEDNIKSLSPTNGKAVINVTLDMNLKTYQDRIFSYKKILSDKDTGGAIHAGSVMYKDFQVNNKKAINYMVKEFEMKKKASEYKRATVSKTGVLDTLKMNNYKFSDDIFKKMTIVPDGKNHGLVMFIDWSGSMASNLSNTVDQLINLVSFCRQVQIPFQVYAFSDNDTLAYEMFGGRDARAKMRVKTKGYTTLQDSFHLLEFFNHKMSRTEFQKMCAFTLAVGKYWENRYRLDSKYGEYWVPRKFWLSGTPLNDAILSAHAIVKAFQKTNRIDIVNTVFLTDGASNYSYYNRDYDVRVNVAPWNETWIFTNEVTKKSIRLTQSGTNRLGINTTPTFLKSLANYTNSNVIGFHILPRNKRTALHEMGHELRHHQKESMWARLLHDSFVVNTTNGYTKQFLVQGSKLATSNGAIEVDEGATKGKIRQAFKKATTGSRTSRVMLSQFIELVA